MASSRKTPLVDNILTYDSAGGEDYDSLAAWETARQGNLTSTQQGESLLIRAGVHNDSVQFSGWTTSADYFPRLFGDPASHHGGIRGQGAVFSITADPGRNLFSLVADHAKIQDLGITANYSSSNSRNAVDLFNTGCEMVGCIVYALNNSGAGTHRTVLSRAAGNSIINCILENNPGAAGVGEIWNTQSSGTPLLVGNVTIYGSGALGINAATSNLTQCINVLVDGLSTCFAGTYTSSGSKNNASSDATAPGTDSRTSQTFTYVDAGNNDYHLDADDEGALGFGFDQSAVYDDDIDVETVSSWSIGADSHDATPDHDTPYDQTGWAVSADSEESVDSDGSAANALNPDTSKIWHTEYSNLPIPDHPHYLVIDMLEAKAVTGILQIPIMPNPSGRIENYTMYYRGDVGAPTDPVNLGEWTSIGSFVFTSGPGIKEQLWSSVTARYLLIATIDTHEGSEWASCAHIMPLGPFDENVVEKPIAGILSPNPAKPKVINAGESVTFTGLALSRHSTAASYLWDFSEVPDIANQTVLSPGALQFDTPGEYAISFKVTDAEAVQSEAATLEVHVLAETPTGTITSPPGDVQIEQGTSVIFAGEGSGGTGPYTYLWTFGDGSGVSNSTAQNPGATQFNTPGGPFTVTFTVTDDNSEVDPDPPTIQVTVLEIGAGFTLTGNGQTIAFGDTSPALADHTDFGEAEANTATVDRTFTIENTGDAELDLDGDPKVAISGTGAAAFSVTAPPSSPLAVDGTTTFTIRFTPTAEQLYEATVSIANSTDSKDPFTFAIAGTGTPAPNVPPVIVSNGGGATAQVTVIDGTTAVTTVAAIDSDGPDPLAYSISGGDDAELFSINSGTGVLTFDDAPVFAAPTDADEDGVYEVEVTVSDGEDTDTQMLFITVVPVSTGSDVPTGGGGGSDAKRSAYVQIG